MNQVRIDTASGPETSGDSRRLCVLLAEDHPANRRVIELMLDGMAEEILAVEDGAQALDAYRAAVFDVILMDMMMPVLDGLAATREIRRLERESGRPRTPIIMLTANAMTDHVQAAKAAGADLHLAKPVTAAALMQALTDAAAASEAEQAEGGASSAA